MAVFLLGWVGLGWTTAQENLSRGCSVVLQVTLAHANARIISSLVPLNKPPLPLGRVCCQLNWEEKVEKLTDRSV